MTFHCRNILLIIFFSFLLNGTLKSQVSGYVFDITDNIPVENVNIVVKGANTGTSTNAKGYFRLNIDNNKAVLIFSHLSFQTDTISLLNATFSKPAAVFLMPKMTHLQEATITSKKIKRDLFWVSDYIFIEKNILVLGNDLYKNVYKLILLRSLNDTITSLYLSSSFKPRGLFIDCMGGYQLIGRDSVFQINIDSLGISFPFSVSIDKFNDAVSDCMFDIKDYLIFKTKTSNEYLQEYYGVNKHDNVSKIFITSNEKRKAKEASDYISWLIKNNAVGMSDISARIRFEKTIMYPPSYLALSKIDNKIYFFNHASGNIEVYSEDLSLINSISISYINKKNWVHRIITDKYRNKAYTIFSKNAECQVAEIDLADGQLKNIIKIPFSFPQNIQINDGCIYFLYHDFHNENKKNTLFGIKIKE
ncbi:MAG: carboxypeptidase-like regulatory domain-containing protein [Lentimicrobiaceae bacterium]|nr:carboxypeptidase-like regulatory domain-containing protein [Lentimicrobiaceae bacterium]